MMRDIAKRALVAVCCAAGLAGFGASAQQAFPNKQIRWVVGYSAGGGSDFVARTIGQVWSEGIGQSVIVDNKPGANTAVAAADVAMARPDGYTVGFVDNGTMVLNPMLYKKLTYDPVHQFKPVTLIGRMPVILVVNANLGIDNVKQYVERAKEKPGSITYGSPGAGNALHLAMEMFNGVAGISTVHAPYRGAAPALSDLAAGHIQAMMVDLAASASFIKSGKIKALAVANATRLQGLPDVPTFSEVGYKGFEARGAARRGGAQRHAAGGHRRAEQAAGHRHPQPRGEHEASRLRHRARGEFRQGVRRHPRRGQEALAGGHREAEHRPGLTQAHAP
jgi:tripartite-type tricarboxylate transporter receptor subunit TctC